ncbi:hypothetical protein LINPERHAP2_LOCUS19396, partial [Linum perenne]
FQITFLSNSQHFPFKTSHPIQNDLKIPEKLVLCRCFIPSSYKVNYSSRRRDESPTQQQLTRL